MKDIGEQLLAELARADSAEEVEQVRIRYLGRKGRITTLAKSTDFSQMAPEERRRFGQQLNELKKLAEERVAEAAEAARGRAGAKKPAGRKLDLTLPGTDHNVGCLEAVRLGIAAAGENLAELLPCRLDPNRVQQRAGPTRFACWSVSGRPFGRFFRADASATRRLTPATKTRFISSKACWST
ncbi:MAG: hypothetical protein ACYTG0_47370 [Planctomycetota bacterium]